MLITHTIRKIPSPLPKLILPVTVICFILAVVAHKPLTARAEAQLLEFWGPPPVQAVAKTVEGNKGILFASGRSGNMDIYWIQPDGTNLKQLTSDPAEDIWPVWSPDGNWVVFQSNRSGNRDIWLMAADGSQKVNLTNHPAMDESPSWTAAGNQIVFSSDRSGHFELHIMNRNGTSPKQITDPDSGMELLPAVSPVEDVVAYSGNKSLIPGWYIYRMSLNGGRADRISTVAGCRAKWSPDGEYLVYVSGDFSGNTDIYTFSKDGRRRLPLLTTPEYDYDPCFSPDGKQICFARGKGKEKSGWDLWIVDLDGSNLRPLTSGNQSNRFPCWR